MKVLPFSMIANQSVVPCCMLCGSVVYALPASGQTYRRARVRARRGEKEKTHSIPEHTFSPLRCIATCIASGLCPNYAFTLSLFVTHEVVVVVHLFTSSKISLFLFFLPVVSLRSHHSNQSIHFTLLSGCRTRTSCSRPSWRSLRMNASSII
jgi:hypothetical protein